MNREIHQKAVDEKKCPQCGDTDEVYIREHGVGVLAQDGSLPELSKWLNCDKCNGTWPFRTQPEAD